MLAGLTWPALGLLLVMSLTPAAAAVLDEQKLLEAQTFWDNQDWDWYRANIPFLDSPDADINTTYYYRWELVTKHLTYGSPESGYNFTEFIDRPFWSGAYGSISCPAGHQLYEVRWLRDKRYAQDYGRYWFRTPGAQPRRYSVWLADAIWAAAMVHSDSKYTTDLLPDLVRNYEGWEKEHFVPEEGLFWQTGHDDGMEYNINSRQTQDTVRGAPGYRATLNSYLWADALAIEQIAAAAGDTQLAARFSAKAAGLKANLEGKLWDPRRQFFFHRYRRNEDKDGFQIKAGTLTYQSGRFAGNPHGRELYNYVPWEFNLPGAGYEDAWKFLMDPEYFFAPFGPTTVERHDPLFFLADYCCFWSGQSWPYATTQTLKALANLLNNYHQERVSKEDYFRLLKVYTLTQRKNGRPYIAEACYPDTGSWEHHDSYNHSEHYFHSGYVDLIITGLIGLHPRTDDTIEASPLVPASWDFFALDQVPYHGHQLSILWDRSGNRYGRGAGFKILADGQEIVSAPSLQKITAPLPGGSREEGRADERMNFAVNNEGTYFPRLTVSYGNPKQQAALFKLNDGNYWYHRSPPNRWTFEGSPNLKDWCAVDFGTRRRIDSVKLYLLDDGDSIRAPAGFQLEYWAAGQWKPVPSQRRQPSRPEGHRANVIAFPALETDQIRVTFTHRQGTWTGLSEIEAWGPSVFPYAAAPAPAGNLALNEQGRGYPKVTASFTSNYDRLEFVNDGRSLFTPTPVNRWTTFGSPHPSDGLEIDFGKEQTVSRVELHIYDDGGGVRAPASYRIQRWGANGWSDVEDVVKTPSEPAGGMINTARFKPVGTSRLRVVFQHQGKVRSGLTEIEVWEK